MSELPKGWVAPSLGSILESKKGKRPSELNAAQEQSTLPYIDIRAFEHGQIRQFADRASSRVCSADDVLIVWDGARSGLVGIGIEGALGSTLAALRTSCTLPKYLFYFLKSQYSHLNTNTKGTGIPHVDPSILGSIPIPLPPLNEQKRIVAKLDELLPKVEACKERLQSFRKFVRKYREAVLAQAFKGLLVSQDPNEEPSACLLKGSGKSINGRGISDLPYGWVFNELGDLVKPSSEKVEPQDLPSAIYLSLEHIEANSRRILKQGIASEVRSTKAVFKAGDVLYGKLRPYLNKVCIPNFDGICSTDFLVFKQSSDIDNRYLMYFLNRRETLQYAHHLSTGVQLPRISFKDLAKLQIPLPPLKEQKRIVKKVDVLLAKAETWEDEIGFVEALTEKLRSSILSKAFSGTLVPQDPNDESAEVLLERIKQAKAAKYQLVYEGSQ